MSSLSHIAFVCPRFAEGATLGGAETLLRALALRLRGTGMSVTFLTTCATDHFTWKNTLPAGTREIDGIAVKTFAVDARDESVFHRVQEALCRGRRIGPADEQRWLDNGVNSSALCRHLQENGERYDRIVAGPYLFALIHAVARLAPEKTVLTPCLHDEPFARLACVRELFRCVRRVMFNTRPERALAERRFGLPAARGTVVGMGMDRFEADAAAAARRHGLHAPYLIYCGRREPMKGTPLLLDYFSTFCRRSGRELDLVLTGAGPVDIPTDRHAQIRDLGFVAEQEKRNLMAGALAFCHPSTYESLGIVLLESWLAGTPALVKAQGEVLRDQCRQSGGGLWFANYPEFEEELTLLLDRPDLAQAMAESGRNFVQKEYAWEQVDQRLLAALA